MDCIAYVKSFATGTDLNRMLLEALKNFENKNMACRGRKENGSCACVSVAVYCLCFLFTVVVCFTVNTTKVCNWFLCWIGTILRMCAFNSDADVVFCEEKRNEPFNFNESNQNN